MSNPSEQKSKILCGVNNKTIVKKSGEAISKFTWILTETSPNINKDKNIKLSSLKNNQNFRVLSSLELECWEPDATVKSVSGLAFQLTWPPEKDIL